MAKKQTFEDKSKKKGSSKQVTVQFIKTYKSDTGSYKFQEKFVKLDDISKVTTLK